MDDQLFKHIIEEYCQFLVRQKLVAQSMIQDIEVKEEYLNSLTAHREGLSAPSSNLTKGIAVSNGRPIKADQLYETRRNVFENFDVVLKIPERELWARENPTDHTLLKKCSCEGLGPKRMKILQFMLEHPKRALGIGNIREIDADFQDMKHDALAHTIRVLRKELQQARTDGPYILTEENWDSSVSLTGKAYRLNQKWKYLVIRTNNFENHQIFNSKS